MGDDQRGPQETPRRIPGRGDTRFLKGPVFAYLAVAAPWTLRRRGPGVLSSSSKLQPAVPSLHTGRTPGCLIGFASLWPTRPLTGRSRRPSCCGAGCRTRDIASHSRAGGDGHRTKPRREIPSFAQRHAHPQLHQAPSPQGERESPMVPHLAELLHCRLRVFAGQRTCDHPAGQASRWLRTIRAGSGRHSEALSPGGTRARKKRLDLESGWIAR
jgi:hypothetical protein